MDEAGLDLTFSVTEFYPTQSSSSFIPDLLSSTSVDVSEESGVVADNSIKSFNNSQKYSLVSKLTNIVTNTRTAKSSQQNCVIVDLKPNGRNISVTNSNKFEYITLMTEYKLIRRVKHQIDAFKAGLYEIIPPSELSLFTEQELELLITGLPFIDIGDHDFTYTV